MGTFVVRAALGGQAILARTRGLNAEQSFSYNVMRLMYTQAPRLREHFGRNFADSSGLHVHSAARRSADEADILPNDLGLDDRGGGSRWTVSELLERGRARAINTDGMCDPDQARCIAAGLYEAALRNPLAPESLSAAEGLALVRLALFDLGPTGGTIPPAVRQAVEERFLEGLEAHIDDDTVAFNRWFFDGRDNHISAIAKRRGGLGPIDRQVVREVLLEMSFQSHLYVGGCVVEQMRAFARALPMPLSPREVDIFSLLYGSLPYLGGIPLILLKDRFSFLRNAVLEALADPGDCRRIGALLRMLDFYGTMTSRRRQADCTLKRKCKHRNRSGRLPLVIPTTDEIPDTIEGPNTEALLALAEALRRQRGIVCPCGEHPAWVLTVLEGEPGDAAYRIDLRCATCGSGEEVAASLDELRRLGR